MFGKQTLIPGRVPGGPEACCAQCFLIVSTSARRRLSSSSTRSWQAPAVRALLLLSRFGRVRLCATPQTAAHQAPPCVGFSGQEHWRGLPCEGPKLLYPDETQRWKQLCLDIGSRRTCRGKRETGTRDRLLAVSTPTMAKAVLVGTWSSPGPQGGEGSCPQETFQTCSSGTSSKQGRCWRSHWREISFTHTL